MEDMERYWAWFCSIPNLYRTQREILLRCFQNPKNLYEASTKELNYVRDRGCRWMQRVIDFKWEQESEAVEEELRQAGISFVSHEGEGYPERLLPLRDHPYGLFYIGELPNKERRLVAIVGARTCTGGGRGMAENLARAVVRAGGEVVSGAAYGIDGAAQWAALEAGGKSYGVLGCGVDVCYPSTHRRLYERIRMQGGLISEFPPGTRPLSYHFPMRNRIISGLSDVVVVVEARKRSGSLITAECAIDQGRQVFAVPGRPDDGLSSGCNELISQGACLVLSVDSFIEAIFPDYKPENAELSLNVSLAPREKVVYSSLGLQAKSLWDLEENTALPLDDLSDLLLQLELKGVIRETEPNFYVKVK